MKTPYTLLGIVSIAMLPLAGISQNLIVNGGFETATVPVPIGTPFPFYPATLDGWSAVNTDGEFVLGPTQAHTGNGFMSMLENGNQNPGAPWLGNSGAGGFDRGVQEVEVTANTEYELTYWYRAGDGSRYGYGAGNALIQVEEVLPTFQTLATAQHAATGVWQQASLLFTTGAATTRIMVLFSALGSGTTDTWYDDLDLQPSSGKGVWELELAAEWMFDAGDGSLWVKPANPAGDHWIDVHDATGAHVAVPTSLQGDRWALDLSGLSNGAYIAVLRNAESRSAYRVVLTR